MGLDPLCLICPSISYYANSSLSFSFLAMLCLHYNLMNITTCSLQTHNNNNTSSNISNISVSFKHANHNIAYRIIDFLNNIPSKMPQINFPTLSMLHHVANIQKHLSTHNTIVLNQILLHYKFMHPRHFQGLQSSPLPVQFLFPLPQHLQYPFLLLLHQDLPSLLPP